ncbi:MAG: FAD-dependent oxidoreductase [Phycisphaerae bacterium]
MPANTDRPTGGHRGRRIAVIGAGPIGLEAALRAARDDWHVDVYDATGVGGHIARWGHVVLFTPFSMNHSPHGVQAIRAAGGGGDLPLPDAFITGRDYVDRYLTPLSRTAALAGTVHERHRVIGVARSGMLKGEDVAGHKRMQTPFRLLIEDPKGAEYTADADVVIDASGTYGQHNWLGSGGIPAVGERRAGARISYGLDDITGRDRHLYTACHTLLIGAGYSAATSIVELAKLVDDDRRTRVIWITKSLRDPPIREIPDDRLYARAHLARSANAIATQVHPRIRYVSGAMVDRLEPAPHGAVAVHVTRVSGERHVFEVHRVIANVGYHPDRSLYRELHVHECFATMGPMKLAAALAGEPVADCLQRKPAGGDALTNPEPDFFVLGAKSYGRDPTFLMQTGIAQVDEVFSLLTGARGGERASA